MSTLIESYNFVECNTQNNIINCINHVDLIHDMFTIIMSLDNNINKLKEFISKYNLFQDKITDIYSYYEYQNDNININIILLENNYIYNFHYKESDKDIINAYELSLNIHNNNVYSKCITNKKNIFKCEKYNNYIDSIFNVYNNTNFEYIFNSIKNIYIDNLFEFKTYFSNNINNINYFTHTKINNLIQFKTTDTNILYHDKHLYFSTKNNDIHYIIYIDNYEVETKNTFHIKYIKEENNITKQIYIHDILCFDSELYIDSFSHKINKLTYDLQNVNIESKELPYFLFDKNTDKNLLTVFAFNEPMKYTFILNILNINSEPTQNIYTIDNYGKLFSIETNTVNNISIKYYEADDIILFEKPNKYNIDLINKYNESKNKYEEIKKQIISQRYESGKIPYDINIDIDIFNKEYEIGCDNYIYKFIINCGLTQSKQINNIAIVVESETTTHDISKIILKNDGTAEIIRTNNNNQLIVKSATRNKFEGNIGYKFAISGGIPCVVSLDIPDNAEVVFDHYHNKFRCNKCVVKDIQPISNINKKIKEIENTCSVCLTEKPNVMFSPCQHVACSVCVASVTSGDHSCYECEQKIESFITMKQDLISEKIQIEKANSAIYCTDFEYKIGDIIIIDNFDITQYWKCSSGIHFHNKIDDVYNWLEFIDIPKELN